MGTPGLSRIRPPLSPGDVLSPTGREVTPPLGLPPGSVRALLVVILSLTFWYLVYRGLLVPDYLAQTVFLAVAFYFGARTSDEKAPSEKKTRAPLGLPRGFVRGFVSLGFLGLYAYLWFARPADIPPVLAAIFELLIGYVAGVVLSAVVRSSSRRTSSGALAAFGHARALLCLVGVVFLSFAAVTDQSGLVPPLYIPALQFLVSFYFGSRSVR